MSLIETINIVPSQKFFQRYSYIHILEALGVTCNSKAAPLATACPKCRKTCWIHGVMPFGGWLNCENCGLKGDPIRVYQLVYRLPNLTKVRKAIEQEFRSYDTFDEDWERYEEFYEVYYEGIEKLWTIAQRNASNYGQSYHARRLYDLDLWRDQATFNKAMASKVGMIHRDQAKDILGDMPKGLKGKGYTRSLVMPAYWVPGLISGFAYVGNRDKVLYIRLFSDRYGGFFNLTNSCAAATTVFAVDSPMQVLYAVLKECVEGVEFPPIVSPFPSRGTDWGSIRSTLVYWHDDPEPEDLRNYLFTPNFQITLTLCPPKWPSDKYRSEAWKTDIGPQILRNLNAKSRRKDAYRYCAGRILILKRNQQAGYVDRLALYPHMRETLLSKCANYQRKKLQSLLNDVQIVDSVTLRGTVVYEKRDQWYIRRKGDSRAGSSNELISEVTLVLETVYHNADTSVSSYAGHITYGDYRVKFVVKSSELTKNPQEYIERICAHAGIETLPYISDWAKNNLLKIAKLFRPPEVVKVRNEVGFDHITGRFFLPRTVISGSNVEVGGQYVYPQPNLPGERVGYQLAEDVEDGAAMFNVDLLRSWVGPQYECVGYWATIAAILQALYSRIDGGTRTGIVLVGDKGSLAEHLFDIFRYDWDLLKSDLGSLRAKKIATVSMNHDLPLAIDGLRCNRQDLKKWVEGAPQPNTLLLVDPLYASSMGADPDWVFIRAEYPPLGGDSLLAGTEAAVASFIQYMLITQPQSLQNAFQACSGIADKLEEPDDTIQKASRISSAQGYLNSRSELAHFLGLIDEMLDQGILTENVEIRMNNPKKIVRIHLNKIRGKINAHRLYPKHWDLRDQLETFGFHPSSKVEDAIYKGPLDVWEKLMATVIRLKKTQRNRGKTYAHASLK